MTEEWLGMGDICFVTGKIMAKDEHARWTDEFDAWVSEEGQKQIEERATGQDCDEEARIIYGEWYWKDEANAANDEFRGWHK